MVSALALAILLHGPDSVLLRFNPPLNKTYKYAYQMTMKMAMPEGFPGGNMDMSTTYDMVMTAVARKGDVTTMESLAKNPKVTVPADSPMAGMKAEMEKGMGAKSRTDIDSLYRIKSAKVDGSRQAVAAGAGVAAAMQGMAYPTKALKVGDTWTSSMDMSKMMGAMGGPGGPTGGGKIPLVFRLEKISGGLAFLKMMINGDMPLAAGGQSMKMKMKGLSNLSVEIGSGMTRNMTMTMDVDINFAGQTMKQHQTQTMKLLP